MITEINIDASRLDNNFRRDKMSQVAQEFHRVINSTIFRDQILKMKPKVGERSKYKDLSNMEIYKMIMHGKDIHETQTNHAIDIFIDDYYTWKRVIGYTNPRRDRIIRVNTKYFDHRHTMLVGSNLLHEYGHLLGFSHDFFHNDERPSSICYQLNKAYEVAYSKLFNMQLSYVKVCRRDWRFLWLRKICKWEGRLVNAG